MSEPNTWIENMGIVIYITESRRNANEPWYCQIFSTKLFSSTNFLLKIWMFTSKRSSSLEIWNFLLFSSGSNYEVFTKRATDQCCQLQLHARKFYASECKCFEKHFKNILMHFSIPIKMQHTSLSIAKKWRKSPVLPLQPWIRSAGLAMWTTTPSGGKILARCTIFWLWLQCSIAP